MITDGEQYEELLQLHTEFSEWLQEKKITFLQDRDEIINLLLIAIEQFAGKKEIGFIEVGLLRGASFTFIGNTLAKYFEKVYGIGIDLPNQTTYKGENVDPVAEVANLSPNFEYDIVVGDSQKQETQDKVGQLVQRRNCPFSLLFVDGDHSERGCMSDYQNYSPHIQIGGLLAFHDIGESHFDVRTKAWPAIKKQYDKSWDLVSNMDYFGIGVAVKDK